MSKSFTSDLRIPKSYWKYEKVRTGKYSMLSEKEEKECKEIARIAEMEAYGRVSKE